MLYNRIRYLLLPRGGTTNAEVEKPCTFVTSGLLGPRSLGTAEQGPLHGSLQAADKVSVGLGSHQRLHWEGSASKLMRLLAALSTGGRGTGGFHSWLGRSQLGSTSWVSVAILHIITTNM